MKAGHELTLVLMDSLDLNVKNGVDIDIDFELRLNVGSQTNLVLLF
jgi:hypothetical protein